MAGLGPRSCLSTIWRGIQTRQDLFAKSRDLLQLPGDPERYSPLRMKPTATQKDDGNSTQTSRASPRQRCLENSLTFVRPALDEVICAGERLFAAKANALIHLSSSTVPSGTDQAGSDGTVHLVANMHNAYAKKCEYLSISGPIHSMLTISFPTQGIDRVPAGPRGKAEALIGNDALTRKISCS